MRAHIFPMAYKRYLFDFWHVHRPKDAKPFSKLLEAAIAHQRLATRLRLISEHRLRYESLTADEGFWVGDITKFRDDTLPNKAGPKSPRQPVPLARDERTTEDTAFGYHTKLNILITQANHFGSSANQITQYFGALAGDPDSVFAEPIVSTEGWARLRGMHRITKLVYAIAPGKRFNPDQARHLSVQKTLEILQATGGRRVTLEVSVGHAKEGLIPKVVKKMARALFRMADGDTRKVPKLQVTGKDEDDVRDSFDLMEYRIRQPIDLEVKGRSATDDQRMNAVKQAFRARADDLNDAKLDA